jgi:hypothetical protein
MGCDKEPAIEPGVGRQSTEQPGPDRPLRERRLDRREPWRRPEDGRRKLSRCRAERRLGDLGRREAHHDRRRHRHAAEHHRAERNSRQPARRSARAALQLPTNALAGDITSCESPTQGGFFLGGDGAAKISRDTSGNIVLDGARFAGTSRPSGPCHCRTGTAAPLSSAR